MWRGQAPPLLPVLLIQGTEARRRFATNLGPPIFLDLVRPISYKIKHYDDKIWIIYLFSLFTIIKLSVVHRRIRLQAYIVRVCRIIKVLLDELIARSVEAKSAKVMLRRYRNYSAVALLSSSSSCYYHHHHRRLRRM